MVSDIGEEKRTKGAVVPPTALDRNCIMQTKLTGTAPRGYGRRLESSFVYPSPVIRY